MVCIARLPIELGSKYVFGLGVLSSEKELHSSLILTFRHWQGQWKGFKYITVIKNNKNSN